VTKRTDQIGFSQRVRQEWFERTVNLILAGSDKPAITEGLQELLRDKVSVGGQAVRGNREKIITILLKTWLTVPVGLELLRDTGLDLIKRLPRCDHMVVHWGMVSAVYPFWAGVASQTGRLLRLQGAAGAAHVQRRVREQYGERDTVSRAARRVLRSFVDWDVLRESGVSGVYESAHPIAVDDRDLAAWLIEAMLLSGASGPATLKSLIDSTALFPFRLPRISAGELVASSKRLDIITHSLDEELVVLKHPMTSQDS
jgi:hypothetical protein